MHGNILVVDDSAPALKLLRDILAAEGYSARPFNNGELALRSVHAEPPDLILLDVRMPGMDGIEVCRRIRADGKFSEIPVIFISGATDTEDKLKAFEAGGVDYITKPFQREEVLARVRTHVELHRSARELKEAETALRKSEQTMKIAQAVAHLGHWEMDAETGQVHWSDETFRIFGFQPHAFAPSYDTFLNAVHPDDRARVAQHIEQARHGGEFNIEFRIVLPDGRIRVIDGRGILVTYPDMERRPEIVGIVQQRDNEVIGVIQDITKRKEMESRLEREARTDALTGCMTRRYFLELARKEFSRARRHGARLSILMADLDHFKAVNDAHGHHAGDLALQAFAGVCRQILRQEDSMGRLGGEEFAILLADTGRDKGTEVAERLRAAVAAASVPLEDRSILRITASIGVAAMSESDRDLDMLIERADHALYGAKHAGRNRVA